MKKITFTIVSLIVLLSGCGGGGGGEPTSALSPAAPDATPAAAPPAASTPPAAAAPPVATAVAPAVAQRADDGDIDDAAVLTQPDEPSATDSDDTVEEGGSADFAFADYALAHLAANLQDAGEGTDLGAPVQTAASASRPTLYVSTTGSDSNPGTSRSPLRSIAKAARAAKPGTRIMVAPGSYSGGFRTTVDGTAAARISFVSSAKWGARIVPPRSSPNRVAWDNRGDYVDIIGFDVDGSKYQGGTRWARGIYNGGSHVSVRNNLVHHVAQDIGCDGRGGAGIGMDSYYGGVKADVISNLVHDIGPAGCRFVQGIYISTSGRVKNNVVYRVAAAAIHLWHDAHDVIITNNTVSGSTTGIIVGGGNFYHSSKGADQVAVYSNIVYDNVRGISEQGKTGKNNTYRNNLVYQNSSYDWSLKNGLTHTGTVSAPPQFLAYARSSKPNLKLTAASPAIGRATPLHAESTDFEGKPRNAAVGYDIGAYQHR